MKSAGISKARKTPLFRSVDRTRKLTARGMHRNDVLRMIKTRAAFVSLPAEVCCHTFRATGITAFLENGGSIEQARRIANHESSRTTKLYDRTSESINLDEVERIRI
jgi:integrase